MPPIDWRALYASNQAAIENARSGRPIRARPFVSALPAPGAAPPRLRGSRRSSAVAPARAPMGDGRLDALVHVPAGLASEVAVPLVCMLHGCTQDPAGFAASARMNATADRHGFVVVYPRQTAQANPQRCWNWFAPEHQRRGGGEPAAIAATIRRLLDPAAGQAVDPRRVFVAGLSSGGAMAAVLAFTHPELVAAFAVHSGLAYGAATTMGAAFSAMAQGAGDPATLGVVAHAAMGRHARPIPSMVLHGTGDATVAPVNAEQVLCQSMEANRLAAPTAAVHDPARPTETLRGRMRSGHAFTRSRWTDGTGAPVHEALLVHGMGHAWSGGVAGGSHTDPRGPDATEAIWRFFSRSAADAPVIASAAS